MENVQKQVPKFSTTSQSIYHNAMTKLFPRLNQAESVYASRSIFREPGWEEVNPRPRKNDAELGIVRRPMGEDSRDDSILRAKKAVRDIAKLNAFEYFVTWTLNPALIDRYDHKTVAEKMQNFLANKVQTRDLMYIIVPELHKDGAIHAHGFISGKLKMVNSGKVDSRGRTVWNMPQWKWGFTTAVRISGDYNKASQYITKYIEKKSKMVFGNFYYAGGHGLNREAKKELHDVDYPEIDAKEYFNTDAAIGFKYETYDTLPGTGKCESGSDGLPADETPG